MGRRAVEELLHPKSVGTNHLACIIGWFVYNSLAIISKSMRDKIGVYLLEFVEQSSHNETM